MTRRLGIHKAIWPLKAPFRITGHTFTTVDAIVVEIEEGGIVGRGEGVGVYYLEETADSLLAEVELVRSEIERGVDQQGLLSLMKPGGARNAVDSALWDLTAQQQNKSIWELTGIAPGSVETVFTIGIEDDPKAMSEKAVAAADYKRLKIKLSADEPANKLRAVRDARPDATIIIDANQGFTPDLLQALFPVLSECEVSMLEQPLPRGDEAVLTDLTSPVPICADESCLNLQELHAVADKFDMINIKLDKSGGLTEALAIAHDAEELGKRIMVGNMLGSSLSMAPAFVLAQKSDFVDIDGPLSNASDYLSGLRYEGGKVRAPARAFWANMHQV